MLGFCLYNIFVYFERTPNICSLIHEEKFISSIEVSSLNSFYTMSKNFSLGIFFKLNILVYKRLTSTKIPILKFRFQLIVILPLNIIQFYDFSVMISIIILRTTDSVVLCCLWSVDSYFHEHIRFYSQKCAWWFLGDFWTESVRKKTYTPQLWIIVIQILSYQKNDLDASKYSQMQ